MNGFPKLAHLKQPPCILQYKESIVVARDIDFEFEKSLIDIDTKTCFKGKDYEWNRTFVKPSLSEQLRHKWRITTSESRSKYSKC